MRQHPHLQRPRSRRHFRSHSSESNKSQHFPAQLRPESRRFLPPPRVYPRVQLRNFPRQRRHQSKRVLRHAHRVSARRVHHQHAAPRRCVQVDVVHSHSRASHHPQLRRPL